MGDVRAFIHTLFQGADEQEHAATSPRHDRTKVHTSCMRPTKNKEQEARGETEKARTRDDVERMASEDARRKERYGRVVDGGPRRVTPRVCLPAGGTSVRAGGRGRERHDPSGQGSSM
jgi:hypothetical protein